MSSYSLNVSFGYIALDDDATPSSAPDFAAAIAMLSSFSLAIMNIEIIKTTIKDPTSNIYSPLS